MIFLVLIHWCRSKVFLNCLFIFSMIAFDNLQISSFAGFFRLVVVLLSKFSLWSFKVIKRSFFPFTWILLRMSFFLRFSCLVSWCFSRSYGSLLLWALVTELCSNFFKWVYKSSMYCQRVLTFLMMLSYL